MSQIEMRTAGVPDLVAVTSWINTPLELLMWAGTKFIFPIDVSQFTENLLKDDVKGFVFQVEGDIIGYGEVSGNDAKKRSAFLSRLIVKPTERGKEYSHIILRGLIGYCRKELLMQTIFLNVFKNNTIAFNLYEREGFMLLKDKNYVSEFYGIKETGIRTYYIVPPVE